MSVHMDWSAVAALVAVLFLGPTLIVLSRALAAHLARVVMPTEKRNRMKPEDVQPDSIEEFLAETRRRRP